LVRGAQVLPPNLCTSCVRRRVSLNNWRTESMKLAIGLFVVLAGIGFAVPALSGPDDAKWIAQCVSDNKNAKVPVEVITKYCTCMNNKMDDNETQSITQWEKTHKAEREACDKEAGWK